MRTTKPISTISFNTTEFLYLKLEELTKAGILEFWAFIYHQPEDDETNKPHHHVYVVPAKILQTTDLQEQFKEFDPSNEKPRGTLPWNSSKFDHWCMYALHDKRYLASKGQSRKYSYLFEELITSDPDQLLYLYRTIDMLSLSPYSAMLEAQAQGLRWEEFFAKGGVPLAQVALCERAWNLLMASKTDRNGREGHSNES